MKPCSRKLDPLDVEALASAAEPVLAPDAAAHAAACPECASAVQEARLVGDHLSALTEADAEAGSEGLEPSADFASRILRIRPISRRERLSVSLWAVPAAFSAGLFASGIALLGLPFLSGGEQAGLGAAALLPAAAVLRSAGRWLTEVGRAAPAGLTSLSEALRQEQTLGLLAALLFVPLAFGLKRVLARARR